MLDQIKKSFVTQLIKLLITNTVLINEGFPFSYSGGFIASYGHDVVFVFEQQASTGEEFNFKCIKRIKFPKVLIIFTTI